MPSWSEETEGNTPGDRRAMFNMGPVTLLPGDTVNIDLLFAFLPNASGGKNSNLNYRSRLDSLITWFHEDRIPYNYLAAEYANISSEAKENTKLYPNPANDKLYISNIAEGTAYEIFDRFGRKIMAGKYQHAISLNELSSGVYYVRYEKNQQSIRKGFVVVD